MTLVKNRLLDYTNTYIFQDDNWFKFSIDSVLLANFVKIRLSDKKIIDFCTGNAPIPLLLSFRTKADIYGIEVQNAVFKLGEMSVKENLLDSRIKLINDDVKNVSKLFPAEFFDVVTCNPPYFKISDGSLLCDNNIKSIARHEILINLEDIVRSASFLLKKGGTFAMVHRPERIIEIILLMKKYSLEPKKIQFVYPKNKSESNILLIEGMKGGKEGVEILSPLILHDFNGDYTEDVKVLFHEK